MEGTDQEWRNQVKSDIRVEVLRHLREKPAVRTGIETGRIDRESMAGSCGRRRSNFAFRNATFLSQLKEDAAP